MLCKRIIPTLLVRGRTLVKGEGFNSWRSIGHALQGARVFAAREPDELVILDIGATAAGRGPDVELVLALTEGSFTPIAFGGGVRSLEHIDQLLRAGADKVCIGAGFYEMPDLVSDAAARFGSQAIVVCVDQWISHVRYTGSGGVKVFTLTTAVEAASQAAAAGAGEIMVTSIERDGTMQGYDLALIREVSQAVDVPVIASGGCSGYGDMLEAFRAGADACAAGALFAFTDSTPRGAAQFLKRNHIEVRL